ncbi:MAG TPA: UDP-N-acetylglucosamine 2-epimerase (non-hydrolyzing) [Pyrinomonadaceae bacterium]|nr:UDP-N-acetylglucosamine 2-epimerase (non-hydrolyzing) [Pyrinomonadaceae bacterium]
MKIMTVLGTRPEIIRLSRVIEKLDRLADSHTLVHTGQNFDASLSDVFFEQLGVRRPDHYLGARGESFGEQIGQIITLTERVMREERPDRLLILGDTNSALSAVVAKRLGIPVFHMEAGNRCYDDRVPEEVNRRVIDHSSDVLMPYTERSRQNLLREGFEGRRVFVVGNPIYEVLRHHEQQIQSSDIHARLGLEAGRYFLVTMHREENVDVEDRLRSLISALEALNKEYGLPVVCSLHPRTRRRMEHFGVGAERDGLKFLSPLGLFDFVALEQRAFCVLSDSGTVQEECCIFNVANVTLRDVTERPETLECGSNILSGASPQDVMRCVRTATERRGEWEVPPEYLAKSVSDTASKLVLGYNHQSRTR